MTTFIWVIVGIVLLAITTFVHIHTYVCVYNNEWDYERVKIPVWAALLVLIMALIPILNVTVFVGGLFGYITSTLNEYIEFRYNNKYWNKVKKFLLKKI